MQAWTRVKLKHRCDLEGGNVQFRRMPIMATIMKLRQCQPVASRSARPDRRSCFVLGQEAHAALLATIIPSDARFGYHLRALSRGGARLSAIAISRADAAWHRYSSEVRGVRRPKAEAGGEFLGALQCSFALFKTGAMIPEVIFKSRIALDSLSTTGTFFPVECIAERHHASSKTPDAGGR